MKLWRWIPAILVVGLILMSGPAGAQTLRIIPVPPNVKPQWQAVPEAPTVSFAPNVPTDVFRYRGRYYLDWHGAWFQSRTLKGPWDHTSRPPRVLERSPAVLLQDRGPGARHAGVGSRGRRAACPADRKLRQPSSPRGRPPAQTSEILLPFRGWPHRRAGRRRRTAVHLGPRHRPHCRRAGPRANPVPKAFLKQDSMFPRPCEVAKTIPKPSHNYTTPEMSEVMDRFEAWCAREMGVMLG